MKDGLLSWLDKARASFPVRLEGDERARFEELKYILQWETWRGVAPADVELIERAFAASAPEREAAARERNEQRRWPIGYGRRAENVTVPRANEGGNGLEGQA